MCVCKFAYIYANSPANALVPTISASFNSLLLSIFSDCEKCCVQLLLSVLLEKGPISGRVVLCLHSSRPHSLDMR